MRSAVVAGLALAAAAAGCGGEALRQGMPGQGQDAGSAADGPLVPGPVTGTFIAPGAIASIAYPGGGAFLVTKPNETPPFQFFLSAGDVQLASTVTFTSPPGLAEDAFDVSIQIASPSPGLYRSSDGCGSVSLSGAFEDAAVASCSAFNDAGVCPPGCAEPIGLLADQSSCIPIIPGIAYQAVSAAQCPYDGTSVGSWTLSLTSASQAFGALDGMLGDSGTYLVHGTLVADLPGGPRAAINGAAAGTRAGTDAGTDAGLAIGFLQLEF